MKTPENKSWIVGLEKYQILEEEGIVEQGLIAGYVSLMIRDKKTKEEVEQTWKKIVATLEEQYEQVRINEVTASISRRLERIQVEREEERINPWKMSLGYKKKRGKSRRNAIERELERWEKLKERYNNLK